MEKNRLKAVYFCLLLPVMLCGCRTVRESTPARTATEQLLLSTAADNALQDRFFAWLTGKKVFVEEKYFESYDKGNVISELRERISASGALLMKTGDNADTIVEIRSAAFSVDNSSILVGLPAMTLPIPLTGPVQTPEIAFYKSAYSDSVGKFALFVYERESGRHIQTADPMLGRAYLHLYKVLFISWKRTDIPEFKKTKPPRSK